MISATRASSNRKIEVDDEAYTDNDNVTCLLRCCGWLLSKRSAFGKYRNWYNCPSIRDYDPGSASSKVCGHGTGSRKAAAVWTTSAGIR